MFQAFGLLLAYMLPVTAILYFIGVMLVQRLNISFAAKVVGFIISWFSTALLSLLMAEKPNVLSAENEMFPAAIAGVVIGTVIIYVEGKRSSTHVSDTKADS